MLNNREWAILFWLGVFMLWALAHRDIRSSFGAVLRSFLEPKILVPLGLMAIWVAVEVGVASKIGIWEGTLLKDTAIWFVTLGVVLSFNFEEASSDPKFLRRRMIAALLPIAALEVLLDISVLPLIAELILQPLLALLVMMAAVSKTDNRYLQAERLFVGILAAITLSLLARALLHLITNWENLDKTNLLLEVILPGWLTIALLPFIYLLAVYAAYELAFMRINWRSPDGTLVRWRRNLALLTGLGINANEIASFAGPWPHRLAQADSFSEASGVVKEFRDARSAIAHVPL
jgi:hypothetical protein